jgi:ribulose bisphosphate carboxylase small subunit
LPDSIAQPLGSIVALQQKLGIEHVDQRRFRNNSWQCYTTLNAPSQSEASRQIQSCLRQFPEHYIRLVSIEPTTNSRIAETIVHRPVL